MNTIQPRTESGIPRSPTLSCRCEQVTERTYLHSLEECREWFGDCWMVMSELRHAFAESPGCFVELIPAEEWDDMIGEWKDTINSIPAFADDDGEMWKGLIA